MSSLTEAITAVLAYHQGGWRDNGDCSCGYWPQVLGEFHGRHVAEAIAALFTVEAFRVPDYDVEVRTSGQLMHYKGLKTVRRWTYTDG